MKYAGKGESRRRSNALRCRKVRLYADSTPEKSNYWIPKVKAAQGESLR